MSELTRRQMMTGAATAAIGAATGTSGAIAKGDASSDSAATEGGWFELECAMKETVLDGHRVRLRAYNDEIPGPVITVTPGETLRIRLKNSLPPYDSSTWDGDHNIPHDLGHTNLHLHGMDVKPHLFKPVGTSDPLAPMIEIPPGSQYEYVFDIPSDHPPGLNWYHPHKHGSTAVQAASGMAGGLIVSGAIDEVFEIKAARDIPLIVQDIGLFPSEDDPDLWTYEPAQNAIWSLDGTVTINGEETKLRGGFSASDFALHYYLLNGEPFFKETHNPAANAGTKPIGEQMSVQRITMAPGEVVRFRILNGASYNMMPLVIDGHDLHLIAMDGVNFPEVRTIPADAADDGDGQIILAPANRADFLVKANAEPGIYKIRQLAQSVQFVASPAKVVAEIEVTGDAVDMALPDKLPIPSREYPLIKPEEVKRVRQIEFSVLPTAIMNTVVGADFMINNALYSEQEVPTVVNLNSVEEWQLSVVDTTVVASHPFHMHVNSFEVISIGGVAQPPGTIHDTIQVRSDQPVVIRVRFKQFVGKAVYHCHILPHEDTGMMQNFLIVDPSTKKH